MQHLDASERDDGQLTTPTIAKEGWPRDQENGPVTLKGADGVLRSSLKTNLLNQPPGLRPLRWLRIIFLDGRSHPSFTKEGTLSLPTTPSGGHAEQLQLAPYFAQRKPIVVMRVSGSLKLR